MTKAQFIRHGATIPKPPPKYVCVIQFKRRGHTWDHPKSFRRALPYTLADSVEECGALFSLAGAFSVVPEHLHDEYKISAAYESVRGWIQRERRLAKRQAQ